MSKYGDYGNSDLSEYLPKNFKYSPSSSGRPPAPSAPNMSTRMSRATHAAPSSTGSILIGGSPETSKYSQKDDRTTQPPSLPEGRLEFAHLDQSTLTGNHVGVTSLRAPAMARVDKNGALTATNLHPGYPMTIADLSKNGETSRDYSQVHRRSSPKSKLSNSLLSLDGKAPNSMPDLPTTRQSPSSGAAAGHHSRMYPQQGGLGHSPPSSSSSLRSVPTSDEHAVLMQSARHELQRLDQTSPSPRSPVLKSRHVVLAPSSARVPVSEPNLAGGRDGYRHDNQGHQLPLSVQQMSTQASVASRATTRPTSRSDIVSDTVDGAAPKRVRVVVRVRPPIAEDQSHRSFLHASSFQSVANMTDSQLTLNRGEYNDSRTFNFDRVLDPACDQEAAYHRIAGTAVKDVMNGLSATVMAYGQTGSGKTHTLFGSNAFWQGVIERRDSGWDRGVPISNANQSSGASMNMPELDWQGAGIVPRVIHDIFQRVYEAPPSHAFRVSVSFLQVYMEKVSDLLNPSGSNLAIRQSPQSGIFVEGLRRIPVSSAGELLSVVSEGAKNRATNETRMNHVSSRSHVFLVITVDTRTASESSENFFFKRGVMTLVDLAGSERVRKSGSKGQRFEEAKNINKSLSTLGKCVAMLAAAEGSEQPLAHLPLRDSALTRLLTDTLEGRAVTTLVAAVSPAAHSFDETVSSLQFARRAMSLKSRAKINTIMGGDTGTQLAEWMLKASKLEEENKQLKEQLAMALQRLNALESAQPRHQNLEESQLDESNLPAPVAALVKRREAAVIQKLGAVIQHLQAEIARQHLVTK